MSDWRDLIGVLKDAFPEGIMSEEIVWCGRNGWDYDGYMAMKRVGVDPRDYNSPLAAFAAAMRRPEVVGALLEAVEKDSIFAIALTANQQDGRKIVNDATLEVGRRWIEAALTAIGAETEGESGDA